MFSAIKERIKGTPLINAFIVAKSVLTRPKSQYDESVILERLLARYAVPRTFVEFGFGGWEFNCAALRNWRGLLIDGDRHNVRVASLVLPKSITARHAWLTLENLSMVEEFVRPGELGILSIDVDGNDYWFLKRLVGLKPGIIIVEYNSSFGLEPVTVPYDPAFDRQKKHTSWTYYGASLPAMTLLAERNGYSLVEITPAGTSAFFVRTDLMKNGEAGVRPDQIFRAKKFPNGSTPAEQFEAIKHLPLVDVRGDLACR